MAANPMGDLRSPEKEAINTMPKRLLGVAAIAAMTAALMLPSAAGAAIKAGDKTFQQTFPVASRLCTEVAAGKRKHLVSVSAAVLANCSTLQGNFTTGQTAVLTARTTITTQISADRAAIHAACPTPADELKPACVSARHSNSAAIKTLRIQLLAATHVYYKTIETDRRAFWAAIKVLRPARHLAPDKPIKVQNS